MKKQLVIFAAFVLAFGMVNGASAHTSQTVGDFEVEVGWESEPPITGKRNAITIMITHVSENETIDSDNMDDVGESQDEMEHSDITAEHDKIAEEHEKIMEEHAEAMNGTMDKEDVETMMVKHKKIIEEHEKIMEEHESMKEHLSQAELEEMTIKHDKIRHEHEMMVQDHEKIIEMYGIDAEAEHDEMEHEDHEETEHEHAGEGVSGLVSTLEVDVTLNDEKATLGLVESEDTPGLYVGEYTPSGTGQPIVHIVGTLDDEVFEIDFHPEEVEDHVIMTPVQQQNEGTAPNEVECSEEKILLSKVSDGSAACVTESTAEKLIARGWGTYF
jgi:hypothetical protein